MVACSRQSRSSLSRTRFSKQLNIQKLAHACPRHSALVPWPAINIYIYWTLDQPKAFGSPSFYLHNMRNITMDMSNGSKPQERTQILPVDNATVPYWRTELHALDKHRTTEELPTECDIAIIGAGMTGVSTAYHISKLAGDRTPSVVILEARQLCSGATGRNGVCRIGTDRNMHLTR